VAITGFVLDFPNFQQTRGDMQFAWTIHVIGSLGFIALILGHIYIGTLGTEGALDGMKTGYVDETWAREHHEDWYDDIKAGRLPAQRSGDASHGNEPAPRREA
jgi:formate dehydrogenase subunit gamma